jgi:Ca-activated chloride channel family protein
MTFGPVFDSPDLLVAAPVIAVGAVGLALWARRRRLRRTRAWDRELARDSARRNRTGPFLVAAAVLAAAIALAGPRGGRAQVTSATQALNVVFAVDISRSMLAEDVVPSRLGRGVREVRRLVQDLQGDRMGLVAFAGKSYILTPLTIDGGAIDLYLDGLDPDLVSEGGTRLAPVLTQGRELLSATSDGADRVLVVFTDGELHDSLDQARAAAKRLAEDGIHLVLVGEGQDAPVRIPVRDSAGRLLEYQKDEDGTVIETARSDTVLQALADEAEGTVVSASLPDQAGAVRDLLALFKRSNQSSTASATLLPQGWIPMLFALLFLFWQTFRRRSAALIALAGLLVAGRAEAQRPSEADLELRRGRAADAAKRYLAEAKAGMAPDTAYYNGGTAALSAGEFEVARKALEEASHSRDPALRYRALYNLGVLSLAASRAEAAKKDEHLQEAAQYLQDALLIAPQSPRAKWNLELARRNRPPPPQSGNSNNPPPPPPKGGTPPPPPKQSDLSRSQAEQILNSVEREEGLTRNRHAGRPRPGAARIKDW